jgi:L-arabinose transport system ATP-binding protein
MEETMTTKSSGLVAMGLSKQFGGVYALSNVNIELRSGEVTAILGENGAGKSTMLKILSGDYIPENGTISVDGEQKNFSSPFDARKSGIRVVSQEPQIVPDVSVAENIFLGKLPTGSTGLIKGKDLEKEAKAALKKFGFEDFLDVNLPAGKLSPAGRQLLEIVRTLSDDPYVVLFDEPTSSLSDRETDVLFALIQRLKDEGHAIGYVSHRLEEIFKISDRVVIIRDGETVGDGFTKDFDESSLIRMMVGRSVAGRYNRLSRQDGGKTVLELSRVTSDDVRDVSLKVRSGEVVVLSGLVGAGRSELVLAVFGDKKIHSGTVSIDGVPQKINSPAEAIHAGIGLLPEERRADSLIMERSVSENATLSVLKTLSHFGLVSDRKQRNLVDSYVKKLEVRIRSVDQLIGELSGGNQQKVILARWLATNLKVIILDEPTRGVDVGAREEIYKIIDNLAQQGLAVLVISSDMTEVLGLADRVIVMKDGTVSGELGIAEATQEKILSLAMSGSTSVTNE